MIAPHLSVLARTSGAVPYALPPPEDRVPGFDQTLEGRAPSFVGKRGPQDYDLKLIDEKRIDDFHVTVKDIATVERTVPLDQGS